jgi:hypothetical protein
MADHSPVGSVADLSLSRALDPRKNRAILCGSTPVRGQNRGDSMRPTDESENLRERRCL